MESVESASTGGTSPSRPPTLHHRRQHDYEGRLLLHVPEVHSHAEQGAIRGDVPVHERGSVASIAGNIEGGKEPVATAGDLHDHLVGVDEVSGGAADQEHPGVVVGGDVLVPGQNSGEDSK